MKVAILTEAGSSIGLGHLSRSIALSDAFDLYNINANIYIESDFTKLPVFDNKNLILLNWLQKSIVLFDICKKNDLIIIDSYKAKKELCSEIAGWSKLTVYIDDYNRINYPEGIIINPTPGAERINYSFLPSSDCLLGHKYIILRKEFWQIPVRKFTDEIRSILLLTGGMDLSNLTPQVISVLIIFFPKMTKTIVLNRAYKNIMEITALSDSKTKIIYNPSVNKIIELMISSDIAITAAGQTMHELATTGTPTVAIGISDNQKYNLAGYHKAGFIDAVIWQNDKNFTEVLKSSIMKLQNKKIRKKKSEAGQKLVDGKGSRKIVEYLIKKYNENPIS